MTLGRGKIRRGRGYRLLRALIVRILGHHAILRILGVLKVSEEGWIDIVHVHAHAHVMLVH